MRWMVQVFIFLGGGVALRRGRVLLVGAAADVRRSVAANLHLKALPGFKCQGRLLCKRVRRECKHVALPCWPRSPRPDSSPWSNPSYPSIHPTYLYMHRLSPGADPCHRSTLELFTTRRRKSIMPVRITEGRCHSGREEERSLVSAHVTLLYSTCKFDL